MKHFSLLKLTISLRHINCFYAVILIILRQSISCYSQLYLSFHFILLFISHHHSYNFSQDLLLFDVNTLIISSVCNFSKALCCQTCNNCLVLLCLLKTIIIVTLIVLNRVCSLHWKAIWRICLDWYWMDDIWIAQVCYFLMSISRFHIVENFSAEMVF